MRARSLRQIAPVGRDRGSRGILIERAWVFERRWRRSASASSAARRLRISSDRAGTAAGVRHGERRSSVRSLAARASTSAPRPNRRLQRPAARPGDGALDGDEGEPSDRDLRESSSRASRSRCGTFAGACCRATVGFGRYTWYTDAERNAVQLPGGVAPPGGASIEIRPADLGTLNGTLTLPLDVSGELRHALAAAQAGYRGEQARVWATTLDQQLAVVRAYFPAARERAPARGDGDERDARSRAAGERAGQVPERPPDQERAPGRSGRVADR